MDGGFERVGLVAEWVGVGCVATWWMEAGLVDRVHRFSGVAIWWAEAGLVDRVHRFVGVGGV